MAFPDLNALAGHLHVPARLITAMEGQLGDFQNRIASLGPIPEGVWRAAAQAARLPIPGPHPMVGGVPIVNRPFHPVETGQVGMLWRVAQRIFWTGSGLPWNDYRDFDVMQPANLRGHFPGAAAAAVGGGAGAGALPANTPRYKASQVTDQGDDSEFTGPTRAEQDTYQANYHAQKETTPASEEEPTEIQVKGLGVRVESGRTPYVDFGVWGPFGRKLLRSMKFRVWVPNSDGTYTQKEMPGPENFLQYTAFWRVYVVAMLMIRAALDYSMELYYKNLEKLLKRWPECWHLIYVADDKMRSEHLEKIRRRISAAVGRGEAPPRNWDALNPWTACFEEASKDKVFWDDNVSDIAVSWMAHGARGAPKSNEEQLAGQIMPGGAASLRPLQEAFHQQVATPPRGARGGGGKGGGGSGVKTRQSPKAKLRQQLAQLKAQVGNGQSDQNWGGGRGRGGGGGRGRGGGGGGGGGRGGRGQVPLDQQACYSFSKGFGDCAECEPGSACKGGRAHKCHLCGEAHTMKECSKKGKGKGRKGF
jgi:hypothetical protein